MVIVWILIGVILLGGYNGLLLLDDKTPESDPTNKDIELKWHAIGAAIFCYIACTAWWIWSIKYVPFVLSSFWLIFGGIVHIVGLNKPFFFVGTTAKTDILIRKVFPNNPENGSTIVKILAFVISVCVVFFF